MTSAPCRQRSDWRWLPWRTSRHGARATERRAASSCGEPVVPAPASRSRRSSRTLNLRMSRGDAQDLGETIPETGFRWGEATALQPRDLPRRNGRPAIRVQRAWTVRSQSDGTAEGRRPPAVLTAGSTGGLGEAGDTGPIPTGRRSHVLEAVVSPRVVVADHPETGHDPVVDEDASLAGPGATPWVAP